MAWTYQTSVGSHYETDRYFWEYLDIREVESTQAGYFRLKITSYVRSSKYGWVLPSRTLYVTYNGVSIDATPSAPQQTLGGDYLSATGYAYLPNSWNGKQLKFNGRLYSWSGITPNISPAYQLTLETDSHVSSATINRTVCGTEFGATGILSSGDAIYEGDVLTVSAQAESGYEIIELQSSYTVSGDTTISISTQQAATVHIFDGTSWARYSLHVYNGTGWDRYQAKIYNGTSWDNYN